MNQSTAAASDRRSAIAAAASTRFHIPSLDGIRALAFLLVFVSHVGLGDIIPGGFGVTVFFFLSGYLITSLLRMENEKTGRISLRNFYLRRVYRIFPPMYITLGIGIALTLAGVFNNRLELGAIAAQMLQLTNYQAIFAGFGTLVPETGIFWSLAIEEHFYLLFPLALLLLIGRTNYSAIARILLFACALMLAWRCLLVFGFNASHGYTYYASDTRVDSILYGCVLALWGNPFLENNRLLDANRYRYGKELIIAASLGVLLFAFLYRGDQFRETFRYTLQGLALFPLFYYAVKCSHWHIFRWLEFSPVRWLGIFSYTLYLSHLLALGLAGHILGTEDQGPFRSALGFGIALTYSGLMFVVIEKPLASLRRKLHSSGRSA